MWIFSSSFQAVHLLLLQLFVLSWMMLHRETEYNQRSQGTRAKVAEPTVLEHIWPEKLTGPPSFILTPNTSYCMENNYLVVVFTRIDEPFIRERFRSTYGRLASKYNFTIVFPLGVTNSSAVNADVLKEHAKHDDILQADFMDTYYNLTLKSYSYRNYVRQHCMSVRVVLKLDDDVVWNVDSMIKYLSQIDDGGNMVLHCRSQKRIFVVRNVTSRWYLHPKEYPYRHFPEYCISGASAATPQTIAALAEASNTVPYVWIDDVWSLGLVPRKVGATFHSMPYGGIKGFFDPFLNGSVIAQDFKRQEEGFEALREGIDGGTQVWLVEFIPRLLGSFLQRDHGTCAMKNYLTAGHEVLLLLQLIVLLLMNLHRHKEHSQCIQKGPRVLLAEKRILEHKFPYKLSAPPRFLLTPAVDHCVKGYYLVIVFTRIDERSVRETFRNTYGRLASKYNFTILFPLGVSESRAVNDNVVKEHAKHGDILQSDFMDTYFNLPLKSYSYREYIRQHCMSVRIVLKIDDDVAWNVDSMIKYLSEIDDGDRAVLHCPSSWNPIVPRHVLYPWYIHPEEYPGKHFPSYCLSGASATTPQTIAKLAEATSTVPFVWLDDVFSNGMVPQKIGATFIHMPFGPDKFPFDSLLNGSVVAQYVLRKRGDGMYLFVRVNGNLLL